MPCIRIAITLLFSLVTFANTSHANSNGIKEFFSNPGPKAERNYLSAGLSLNEFNKVSIRMVTSDSIDHFTQSEGGTVLAFSGLTAQTYGLSVIFGNYIDDTFKTEFRYGTGINYDLLEEVKSIKLDHWMSMLIGADREITDYLRAYALTGISYYQADVTRYEANMKIEVDQLNEYQLVQPSVYESPKNLFETNFSLTWILGFDYKLSDQWYLSFEYGRLLKDTDTAIEVDQYSSYLKFEF